MIVKLRKKPVEITGILWTGENLHAVISFIEGKKVLTKGVAATEQWDKYEDTIRKVGLKIKTLEGDMKADIGDWILKGVKGEFYPCKPDIKELTYDEV